MNLSIIIPAYNVGKYLDDCLASCFRQDISCDDYEVIIINDGSTDNTLETACRWKNEHQNITVISQENKGLSEARNIGIAAAKGDYIMLLDSDDWIADNCLARLISRCHDLSLDMLRIAAARAAGDRRERLIRYADTDCIVSGRSLLMTKINISAPLSIYRKGFLSSHGLSFYPGIYHEDNEFSPRAYYYAERVGSCNDIIYFVRQTPGSITRSANPKKCHDLIIVAERLDEFAAVSVEKQYKPGIYMQIANCFNRCFNEMNRLAKEDADKYLKIIRQRKDLRTCFSKSHSVLHKIEGLLLSMFPNNIMRVYNILDLYHYKGRKRMNER